MRRVSRLGPLIIAVLVTGLLVFVAWFMLWHYLGGGAWRSEVSVRDAQLLSPDRLALMVASCHGAPRVSLEETDVDVQVKVISFSTPLRGGLDCLDRVEIPLQEPLGDRIVVDQHTGQSVNVSTAIPSPELSTNPHFPQMREDGDAMDALLVGDLVLENGCLRLQSMDGTDHLLIWPLRFELTVDGQNIRISNDSGVSLSVGEEIGFGGGEMPLAHLQTLVEEPVPNDCPGPYWVIGEIPAN